MNKLSKKFIAGIICILILSSICSILFNTQFLEKFYLYQKRSRISQISDEFTKLLEQDISPREAIQQIESSCKVIIAEIDSMPTADNEEVNQKIQSAFQEKGVGFQKYWFWEEDYKKVLEGEKKIKLYKQENLNYSLLIDYMKKDSSIYAVTMIVPNVADAFQIANTFLIVVSAFTILIAIIFIVFLVKKITKPLQSFEQFATNMKNNEYVPIYVSTRDELEDVAKSLNTMGKQITVFQKSLQEKNLQMEQLLENVAHDLKTPISLIQLYANGIKDGIDDGTFLETILEENERMSAMVNQLLYLSRIEKKQNDSGPVNLSILLQDLIDKYMILAKERKMELRAEIEKDICIVGNEDLLQSLFSNLITNAVKYASGDVIISKLCRQNNDILFSIQNDTDNDSLDLDKIWIPYYVGEKSRNKKLSGTGLGLSVVKKICETQGYSIDCSFINNKIEFKVKISV